MRHFKNIHVADFSGPRRAVIDQVGRHAVDDGKVVIHFLNLSDDTRLFLTPSNLKALRKDFGFRDPRRWIDKVVDLRIGRVLAKRWDGTEVEHEIVEARGWEAKMRELDASRPRLVRGA